VILFEILRFAKKTSEQEQNYHKMPRGALGALAVVFGSQLQV
jgi:hypothetical protein